MTKIVGTWALSARIWMTREVGLNSEVKKNQDEGQEGFL